MQIAHQGLPAEEERRFLEATRAELEGTLIETNDPESRAIILRHLESLREELEPVLELIA